MDAVTTTLLSFTGDPDTEWCSVSAELIALSDEFEAAPVSDAAEVERTFTAFVDRMTLIAFVAPPEIVDDVAISVDAFLQLRELLVAAKFDLGAVDVSSIQSQQAVIAPASNRISTYNSEVCQLDPDAPRATSAPDDPTAPTPDAVREAAIELLTDGGYSVAEAECITDGLQAGTPRATVLTDCGVSSDTNDG
ncbi:MAG TPA: hypothetical protein VMM60_16515 [Ilumatobacter sp.]|nr:hypothetical protein [Ilumatobacter sp.]